MTKNVTRVGETNQQKETRYMVIDVNADNYSDFDEADFQYLVGYLPKDALVLDAFVFTQTASASAATAVVGTTAGGTEIMSAGDTTTLGATGTFTGEIDTGTGVPVYVAFTANPTNGEFQIVVKYVQYRVNNGMYTITD